MQCKQPSKQAGNFVRPPAVHGEPSPDKFQCAGYGKRYRRSFRASKSCRWSSAHGIETVARHLTPIEQLGRLYQDTAYTFTLLAITHRHGEVSSALLANSLDQSGTHPAEVTVAARTSFVALVRIASGRRRMTALWSMNRVPLPQDRTLSKGKQAQIVHAARD